MSIMRILMLWIMISVASCGDAAGEERDGLPAPTGPARVGRTSFHWKDATREELETKAPGDVRELMVHLFHPTDAKGTPALYVPDADAMRGPWKPDQIERITAMRTHCVENAPLPLGKTRYPVLVFAPGGGMKALTYHALLEDLASHGWIVAAIDPPYNARAVRFPDGRVLGGLPASERGWPEPRSGEEEQRFYSERIVHWSRDVSFVIDQLIALDRSESRFSGRLDIERGVGAFGHSRGGQAAGAVRLFDERVRGGVNIDGSSGEHAILPVKPESGSGAQPFLWLRSGRERKPTDEQLAKANRTREEFDARMKSIQDGLESQLASIRGGALWVALDRPNLQHIDFSDEPLWDGLTTPADRSGKLATIAETRTWVRAFFDGTVRGEWASLRALAEGAPATNSSAKVRVFGKLWPE